MRWNPPSASAPENWPRVDGHRVDLLIAARFPEGFRIGLIGLGPTHVSMHVVRGQQANGVPAQLQASRPLVRRPARLEQHRGGWLLRQVLEEPVA